MPETYTQEQIHNIATALYGWTALPRILPSAPGTGPDWDIGADIRAILSALSTAEQERDALKAQVAELEARMQSAGWISVEERLPKSGKFALANVDELSTPIRAFYAAPNSVEGSCEDEISIFDEEADCYWLPVGWYETNEYEEVSWFVHGKVTHWMPLPEPPAIVGKKEG